MSEHTKPLIQLAKKCKHFFEMQNDKNPSYDIHEEYTNITNLMIDIRNGNKYINDNKINLIGHCLSDDQKNDIDYAFFYLKLKIIKEI